MTLWLLVVFLCFGSGLFLHEIAIRHRYASVTAENCFVAINKKKSLLTGILLCGSCLTFVLLCAYRSEDTPDTYPYIQFYNNILTLDGSAVRFEPLFFALTLCSKLLFGDNYRLYFALVVILNIVPIYFVSRRLKSNQVLFFITYLAIMGINYNFIVLRQGLAITYSICAFMYHADKKYIRTAIFTVISVLFHFSAFIMLFVFLATFIRKKHIGILYVTLVILFISLLLGISYQFMSWLTNFLSKIPFLSRYSMYLNVVEINAKDILTKFPFFILVIQFILGYFLHRNNKYIKNILFFNLLYANLLLLLYNIPIVMRMLDYFLIPVLISFALICDSKRSFRNAAFVAIMSVFFYISVNTVFSNSIAAWQ